VGALDLAIFTAMVTANLIPTDYIATEQLLDNTPLIENLRYSGTN
jgi:hypothetical protein